MSRVQEVFRLGKLIGDKLERIYEANRGDSSSIQTNARQNPSIDPIKDYYDFKEKCDDQLAYICKDSIEYDHIMKSPLSVYFMAYKKYLLSIKKTENTNKKNLLK